VPIIKTKFARVLTACLLAAALLLIKEFCPVHPQVAHANRQLVYDLEERRPSTPEELQVGAAAEQERIRLILVDDCRDQEMHNWFGNLSSPPNWKLQDRKASEFKEACRARILGPNATPEALTPAQAPSAWHAETKQ